MTTTIDTQALNNSVDLRELAAQYTTLKTNGKSSAGPCPKCKGEDRFVVYKDRCLCRKCHGEQYQDPIDFLRWVEGLDFLDAVAKLDPQGLYGRPVVSAKTNGANGKTPTTNQRTAPATKGKPDYSRPEAVYNYRDAYGADYLRKTRYPVKDKAGTVVDKTFLWQHWDGGKWVDRKGDKAHILYNQKAVIEAPADLPIILCEGEKDADHVADLGFVATTNPNGAKHWDPAFTDDLAGKLVVILEDNDEDGRTRSELVAPELFAEGCRVKVITPALGGWNQARGEDVSDWLARSDKVLATTNLQARIDKTPDYAPKPTPRKFEPLSVVDLMQRPAKEWLVDKLIGKSDLLMVFGDAGSGKTFVTLDVIAAAALGRPVAGTFAVNRPLKVAYCVGEGVAGLAGRFAALVNKYQIDPAKLPIEIYTDPPQLYDRAAEFSMADFVKEQVELSVRYKSEPNEPIDLLVIDTLHSASIGADENHAKDAGIIIQAMKQARDVLGCAVMLVHHANRSGNYRGSSALHGAMDTMLQTKKHTENIAAFECFKQKDAEQFTPLYFKIQGEAVSQSAYLEWLEAKTIKLNEPTAVSKAKDAIKDLLQDQPGLYQKAIIDALAEQAGRHTVRQALAELVGGGELTAEKTGKQIYYQVTMF